MKKIISLLLVLTVSASLCAFAAAGDSGQTALLLSELNIMKGDTDGNLRLGDQVTRAEFTKIAVASSALRNSVGTSLAVSPFADVTHDHWAAPYILTGVSGGLCKGLPDGTFNPDGTILYEEALTMMLRVLGYTDSDFGYSWPYGQVGLAANLELTGNLNLNVGDALSRGDVAKLVYNTLDTKMKASAAKLITIFDCRIIEDVTLIATNKQDTSIGGDKVLTTAGTYKFKNAFDDALVGRKGNLVVKNTDDYVAFFPQYQEVSEYTITSVTGADLILDEGVLSLDDNLLTYYKSQPMTYQTSVQKASKGDKLYVYKNENGVAEYARIAVSGNKPDLKTLEKHIVYSQLGNTVLTYLNGTPAQIDLSGDVDVYIDNNRSSVAALKAKMETGDVLYVKYDDDHQIDYVSYQEGNLEGPVTVTDAGVYAGATIVRDGVKGGALQAGDIVYYIKDLNMVLAYNNTKTGIYENAIPNKEMPTSVVISGITYQIESAQAFNKLCSTGVYNYGDTVKLLLGKNNQIADVVDLEASNAAVYGYLFETGEKTYTVSDTNKRTGFYAKLAMPGGDVCEYITQTNYKSLKNSAVRLTFTDGIARAVSVGDSAVSGKVNWALRRLGTESLSENVRIIDVSTTDSNATGAFVRTYPQRIDGLTISGSDILYCEKDGSNAIISLILNNVTGDAYTYGIVTKAQGKSVGMSSSYAYTYNIAGVSKTAAVTNTVFNVTDGSPAKFRFGPLGAPELITGLDKAKGAVTKVTETALTTTGRTYAVSDKATVYLKNYNNEYTVMPISDLMGNNDYSIEAYYDKDTDKGGRIRVMVAVKRTS